MITGRSAEGIGSALAEEFHSNGWIVFATARALEKVQHLQDIGCGIVLLDVTKQETIKASAEVVKAKTGGKLDMLINNAGMGEIPHFSSPGANEVADARLQSAYTTTVLDADMDLVKKTFDVNVFGVIATTQHFVPLLLWAKGTIVNIGSIARNIQGPYCSLYGGSKVALEMISHAMRCEMEPLGLHVVHVSSPAPFFLHLCRHMFTINDLC